MLNKKYYYLWCVWSSSFWVIATKLLRWRPTWKMAARGVLHHMPSSHHRKCWSAHFSGFIDVLHNYPSLMLPRDTVCSQTIMNSEYELTTRWTRKLRWTTAPYWPSQRDTCKDAVGACRRNLLGPPWLAPHWSSRENCWSRHCVYLAPSLSTFCQVSSRLCECSLVRIR